MLGVWLLLQAVHCGVMDSVEIATHAMGELESVQRLAVAGRGPVGIVLLGLGALFLFAGRHLVRVVMFCTGALLVGWAGFTLATCVVGKDLVEGKAPILVGAVAVSGFMGGLLGVLFIKLGAILLGGLLGAGLSILAIRLQLLSGWLACIILSGVLVVVGMVGSYFLTSSLVIVATSFVGALLAVLGIDVFLQAGLVNLVTNLVTNLETNLVTKLRLDAISHISPKILGLVGTAVVLFVVGCAVQVKCSPKQR